MFIEFSNNLIIAPGHQILCLLNPNKQTRDIVKLLVHVNNIHMH